ncbi:MAG: DUF2709 domain-containing protein, partial [Chlamydiia bacterium]|nr:DUF2709 domain-containing protein [Chlamydiia bacterium]
DNTHPNPQDAIYDWVSNCPENTERSGGLRVKRFFVSEDPEVIAHYREKQAANKTITRVVYSSAISGKLFNSKEAIIEEFKRKYLKPITLFEVQNQNKYTIDDELLEFLQNHLHEEGVRDFVRALSEDPKFNVFIPLWLESDEEDDDDEDTETKAEAELVEEDQGE